MTPHKQEEMRWRNSIKRRLWSRLTGRRYYLIDTGPVPEDLWHRLKRRSGGSL